MHDLGNCTIPSLYFQVNIKPVMGFETKERDCPRGLLRVQRNNRPLGIMQNLNIFLTHNPT